MTNTDKIKELLGAELDFEKTKKLKVLMTCVLNLNEHLESNYNDYLEEEEKDLNLMYQNIF